MDEQEKKVSERRVAIFEENSENRHAMGVIVWIAIVAVFVICGVVTWLAVSIPWGVR